MIEEYHRPETTAEPNCRKRPGVPGRPRGCVCEMKVINRLHSRLPPTFLTTKTTTANSGTPPPIEQLLSENRHCHQDVEYDVTGNGVHGRRHHSRRLRKKRRVGWFWRRRNPLQAAELLGCRRRRTDSPRSVTTGSSSFRFHCFPTVSAPTATCSNDGIHHGLCLFQRYVRNKSSFTSIIIFLAVHSLHYQQVW